MSFVLFYFVCGHFFIKNSQNVSTKSLIAKTYRFTNYSKNFDVDSDVLIVFTKMDWHWRKFSEIWFWHFGLNFHTFSLCPNFFKHWLTDLTEPTHLILKCLFLSLIFLTKRFSLFRFIVLIEVLVFLQESLLLWVKSFQKLIVVDVEDAFSSQNLPPKIVWNNFCTS